MRKDEVRGWRRCKGGNHGGMEGRSERREAFAVEADLEMNLAGILPTFILIQSSGGWCSSPSHKNDTTLVLREESTRFGLLFLNRFFL